MDSTDTPKRDDEHLRLVHMGFPPQVSDNNDCGLTDYPGSIAFSASHNLYFGISSRLSRQYTF